jgi:hypothetical protein
MHDEGFSFLTSGPDTPSNFPLGPNPVGGLAANAARDSKALGVHLRDSLTIESGSG